MTSAGFCCSACSSFGRSAAGSVTAIFSTRRPSRNSCAATGDFLADAADDLGLGLADGPSGAFPFVHPGDVDDWNRHGVSVAELLMSQKEN
jgi:hypothetical protein